MTMNMYICLLDAVYSERIPIYELQCCIQHSAQIVVLCSVNNMAIASYEYISISWVASYHCTGMIGGTAYYRVLIQHLWVQKYLNSLCL